MNNYVTCSLDAIVWPQRGYTNIYIFFFTKTIKMSTSIIKFLK